MSRPTTRGFLSGAVGAQRIEFLTEIHGLSGAGKALVNGKEVEFSWGKTDWGVILYFADRVVSFSVGRALDTDVGKMQYAVSNLNTGEDWKGLSFQYDLENLVQGAQKAVNRDFKLKAQMPGKVSVLLVKEGDLVERGQALLVLEAMKMENQIRSDRKGVVKEVKVEAGEAVESGSHLLTIELGA